MPINGIETAYKDRYTFAPPSKRQIKAGSVVHFASAIYKKRPELPVEDFPHSNQIVEMTKTAIEDFRRDKKMPLKNHLRN